MTYLEALESELKTAGIPSARRARIIAEFADHLHEDADARLGAPRELARQFADELGTRLARTAAFRTFGALAFVAVALGAMFLAVGRMRALTMSTQNHTPTPGWAAPILMFAVLAGQVALAAGGTALLRTWWLRRQPVINAREATVLARRSAVGIAGGAVALLALPTMALAFHRQAGVAWTITAWVLTGVGFLALAAVVPSVRAGTRLRPEVAGQAGDLIDDLGPWAPTGLTPVRLAWLVAAAIVVALGAAGAVTDDPYDGIARGVFDAAACMTGFMVLGRYLGLRTAR
ncbi:MAG: hypothetical protein ACRDLT_09500 [Solirubrobacteraceae bacterium]